MKRNKKSIILITIIWSILIANLQTEHGIRGILGFLIGVFSVGVLFVLIRRIFYKSAFKEFLIYSSLLMFILSIVSFVGSHGIRDSGIVAESSKNDENLIQLVEVSEECTRTVEFGDITICLPKIEGMTECYLNPVVRIKADHLVQQGTSTLAYYLPNSIYAQLDKLYTLLYDDYFVIYTLNNLEGVKINRSDLEAISSAMVSMYSSKKLDDVLDLGQITITTPLLIDNYSLNRNVETFILLINTTSGVQEDIIVAIATNILLLQENVVMISYYRFFEGEESYKRMKIKNNEIIMRFLNSNNESSSNSQVSSNELFNNVYELGITFREFLINNNIDININVPNKYESLQQDNKYSNYYFNFSTVFPDNLEIDRGMSEYTIIRGSNKDKAISVSLNVVPKNPELSDDRIMTIHNSFQESPTTTLNNSVDGKYSDVLKTQFEKNSGFPIQNLITEEKKIRTRNYFYYIFNYEEEVEGMVIEFIMEGFQTILWGNTYTFIYSTPKMFYDNSLLEYVLFETNYIRPKS